VEQAFKASSSVETCGLQAPAEVFRAGADEKVPQRLKPTTHIRGRNAGLKALLHPDLTSLTNHAGNFAVSACFLPHYFYPHLTILYAASSEAHD